MVGKKLIKWALVFLGALLVVAAVASLRWRIQHDSPILLYTTFLMDKFGCIPYRDIFDMNLPGTYLAYYWMGQLSGYTDIGMRIMDLSILIAMLSLTWLWMREFGRTVAWCGSILWGLVYLAFGPSMSLQREYLLLLPIIAAVCLHTRMDRRHVLAKNLAIGFLFGIAAIMKPHAAIGLPVLVLFDLAAGYGRGTAASDGKRRLRAGDTSITQILLPAALGFLVPIAGTLLYLWHAGALASFIDIARNYLPLYGSLTGAHETISGPHRAKYILDKYRELGGLAFWTVPAIIGAYVALYESILKGRQLQQIKLMIALTICYSIYPIFSGQFWQYHWLPYLYFLLQLCALCLIEQPQGAPSGKRIFPVIVLAAVIALAMPIRIISDVKKSVTGHLEIPVNGRVDEIATYLEANLKPGDTVQPLDWTGGAVHAMLIARARIATRFIYDVQFYHHVSYDYVKKLRIEFISDLEKAKPTYVVDVVDEVGKPWVRGADTTREFKELQSFLDANYQVGLEKPDYIIYRLKR